MNKAFSRVNWQNLPSKATALSANNLNRGDSALNEIDNRVITLDTTKADITDLNDLVQSITFNSNTGTFTIKKKNGATTIIDTDLEKVAVNFEYDSNNRQLVLYDASHQVVDRVDLSDFITVNEFDDSDTIAFHTEGSNVSAEVKDGSITGDKLQPNYLADIQVQAALANTSAEDAAESASDAKDNKELTEQYRDETKGYRDEAEKFATSDYALEAKSYAIGGTGTREGEDTDNAKYYKEVAEQQTITNITATVDDNVGTPEVEVTHTSPAPNNSFRFDFKNMKGETGDKGDTGVSIMDAYLNDDSHLIVVLDDGTEQDAGLAGTNIKQMTKAEYAALSDEEKNDDGMYYWITDENGGAMTILVATVSDYNEMTNKPKINGVTLEGNMSLDQLGIEGNIIEITKSEFDALPDEEKDDPDIWYWIVEE